MTLRDIDGSFDSWILYHYLRFVNFPFSYWILTRLNKKSFRETLFFKGLSFLCNNICSLTNLSLYDWFVILHSQSGTKFMIGTPVKFQTGTLFSIGEVSRLTIKGSTCYIHNFLKAVGNKIRASSPFSAMLLLLPVFDISIIIYFL